MKVDGHRLFTQSLWAMTIFQNILIGPLIGRKAEDVAEFHHGGLVQNIFSVLVTF